ncbi:hypothetical protein [Burkholderia pseudomallei]|uniref:hypothetical protein n=1 Tax=Burkholderia pseudomallei TaxID=28450 RepID=UPI0011BE4F08|nr:hypothetical protein [Burkholderia pseudomallei]
MFDQLNYKTRATADLAMKAFLRALPYEAQMLADSRRAELEAVKGGTLDPGWEPCYQARPIDTSLLELAGALQEASGVGFTAASLSEWLTGKHRVARKFTDIQKLAPWSATLLDPWGTAGPAARFFTALDSATGNQVNWNIRQHEADEIGHLLAFKVNRSVWRNWEPWALKAMVPGRSLPPGSYISRRAVDALIDEAWANERVIGKALLDQPPFEGEMASQEGAVLWLLHALVWLARHFPGCAPAELGLDLAAMSLVGKVVQPDYERLRSHDYPRAQIARILLNDIYFPLAQDTPVAEMTGADLIRFGIVKSEALAIEMVNAILGARHAAIEWLRECQITAHEVDGLLSSADARNDALERLGNEPPPIMIGSPQDKEAQNNESRNKELRKTARTKKTPL